MTAKTRAFILLHCEMALWNLFVASWFGGACVVFPAAPGPEALTVPSAIAQRRPCCSVHSVMCQATPPRRERSALWVVIDGHKHPSFDA